MPSNLAARSPDEPDRSQEQLRSRVMTGRSHLSPQQLRKLEERIAHPMAPRGIEEDPQRGVGAIAPLSASQERMWFLQQLDPEDLSQFRPIGLRLTGPLDIALLQRSVFELVKRHETLRTVVETQNGIPRQRVGSAQPVSLPLVDLTGQSSVQRRTRTHEVLLEAAAKPLDLEVENPIRGRIVRLGKDEHVVVLLVHRIAVDAWSAGILEADLTEIYDGLVRGLPPDLPVPKTTYAQYATRQREQAKHGAFRDSLTYWTRMLCPPPAQLSLPTEGPRRAVRQERAAVEHMALGAMLVRELEVLAREEGATVFCILLTGFAILLQRYSRTDDLPLGVPIAGRVHPGIEELVGRFVNPLPLRCDLSGNPTVRELLRRIREMLFDALEHQDVPFEMIVEALNPSRQLLQTPLFDVMFNLENVPRRTVESGALLVEPYPLDVLAVAVDLSVELFHAPDGGLDCTIAYRPSIYKAETIRRLFEHYQMLLRALVRNSGISIHELPMLTQSEKNQLLIAWNDTTRHYPLSTRIQELFDQQVERSPERVALVCGDEEVTFLELKQRADGLAHRIRESSITPDAPVTILLERSEHLTMSMLAALKAGHPFLPLNPELPDERLVFMLDDADAGLLLTQHGLDERVRGWPGEQIVLEQGVLKPIPEASDISAAPRNRSSDLACIIYTSGSTGNPKGVFQTQRGIVNHLLGVYEEFGVDREDVVLQVATPSFDMSLRSVLGPLVHGVRCVILTEEQIHSLPNIIEAIQVHHVTAILGITPTFLSALVEEVATREAGIDSLRLLAAGGEILSESLARRVSETLGDQIALFNCYGPTEGTGIATIHRVENSSRKRVSIPIGRPLPNVKVRVLDQAMQLAGIGVPGELYIEGLGVAAGYCNRPALTAERFIPSPFSAGAILCKTGDLARWLSIGELEFLGRVDRQIKLRGYRIEPAEIEVALETYPGVRQAAVVLHEPSTADPGLAAYVACAAHTRISGAGLREYLRHHIPRFMMPRWFVILDAIPSTDRGKVDYQALPEPEDGHDVDRPSSCVEPTTPIQKALARIWGDVLRSARVGLHDDFFALGGHSLALMRVAAAIEQQWGIRPSIRVLYESPTLEGHCRAIAESL